MNKQKQYINELFDINKAAKKFAKETPLEKKIRLLGKAPLKDNDYNINDDNTTQEDTVLSDPLLKQGLPTNDKTFKAVTYIDDDMSTSVDTKFKKNLIIIAKAHDAILDLYESNLYEEPWDDTTIHEFDELLKIYNDAFNYIDAHINNIKWNYIANKNKFFKIYNEIIKYDNKTFNRLKYRHENYKRYRANRKTLIIKIAKIMGCKDTTKKKYMTILRYFNDKCANIPLYHDNVNTLVKWLFQENNMGIINRYQAQNDIIDITGDKSYTLDDIHQVWKIYVKARQIVFKIFNMITSNSELHGWDKWNKMLIPYCDASINDKALEDLYNDADAEDKFEYFDDYQQKMDDDVWNRQGLYESWLDDDLDWYKEHRKDKYSKNKIKHIEMIPTNINVCKVVTDGKKVYANVDFYPDDIVEICPTKPISKSSLYSREMRDLVFEVVPNQEWVLPFGYCKYYTLPNADQDANCDYLWDPISKVIVIKATCKIPKHSKLILRLIK